MNVNLSYNERAVASNIAYELAGGHEIAAVGILEESGFGKLTALHAGYHIAKEE